MVLGRGALEQLLQRQPVHRAVTDSPPQTCKGGDTGQYKEHWLSNQSHGFKLGRCQLPATGSWASHFSSLSFPIHDMGTKISN